MRWQARGGRIGLQVANGKEQMANIKTLLRPCLLSLGGFSPSPPRWAVTLSPVACRYPLPRGGSLPSPPWGRGWTATALSSAGAGRVRGCVDESNMADQMVFHLPSDFCDLNIEFLFRSPSAHPPSPPWERGCSAVPTHFIGRRAGPSPADPSPEGGFGPQGEGSRAPRAHGTLRPAGG
jgi:hypothetical protein